MMVWKKNKLVHFIKRNIYVIYLKKLLINIEQQKVFKCGDQPHMDLMLRSTIQLRLNALEVWGIEHPVDHDLVNLHRGVLKILMPIENDPYKGANATLSEKDIMSLIDKTFSSKTPIINHLNPSLFQSDVIKDAAIMITEHFTRTCDDKLALRGLLDAMLSNEIIVQQALKALIEEDPIWFKDIASKFNVDPSVMVFIYSSPLQPFFEDLSRRLEKNFKENWLEPFCPVCGRQPVIAKLKDRRRYMACMYCGTEYLVDQYTCLNCGNKDPYKLGFLSFKEYPEYELDYCETCLHYIKVLCVEEFSRKIPQGFEDIFTWELEEMAGRTDLGLKRT